MKIYIEKTETILIDSETKDGIFALAFGGYVTYYKILTIDNVLNGKISHSKELTNKEKIELIKEELNITN